jgi:hypothetical protein
MTKTRGEGPYHWAIIEIQLMLGLLVSHVSKFLVRIFGKITNTFYTSNHFESEWLEFNGSRAKLVQHLYSPILLGLLVL